MAPKSWSSAHFADAVIHLSLQLQRNVENDPKKMLEKEGFKVVIM